jgi:hypothetical protein
MARTARRSSSTDAPVQSVDANGKVTNWSAYWQDARDLDMMVQNGSVDNMTPKQIMEKFPHTFGRYTYRAFSSGLTNARRRHNKQVNDRAAHVACGGNRK